MVFLKKIKDFQHLEKFFESKKYAFSRTMKRYRQSVYVQGRFKCDLED